MELKKYTPIVLDWMQSISSQEVSWREVAFILIIAVAVLFLTLHVAFSAVSNRGGTFLRVTEHRSGRLLAAGLISSVILILSKIILEYFSDSTVLTNQIFWILGSLVPTCLAFAAFLRNRKGGRGLLLVGLCICVVSDFLVQIDPPAQLAILCLAQAFFAADFALDRRPGKGQIILMILLIILLFVCTWSIRPLLGDRLPRILIIGVLMILQYGLSMRQRFYVRCGAFLLLMVDVFEITLMFSLDNEVVDLLEHPFYVLALTLLAVSVMHPVSFVTRKKKKTLSGPAL